MPDKDPDDKRFTFFVNALVSAKSLRPQVVIEMGDIKTQCSAEKAREIGLMILRASEAAMSDAFLVRFFVDKTGSPVDNTIGVVLQDFRAFRSDERQKEENDA